ncbi:MAG: CesD/SycD/LcrH family type secretion system chaperone [Proteobacteria bacterium]|nr:CesD/SycD/LcrH family type secretion system chaperone [Pseudomonadota bacterium]
MNASGEQTIGNNVEALFEQVGDAVLNGVPLGTIMGYDDKDYEAVYALGHGFYSQARYLDALKAFAFLVIHQPLERRYNNAYASCLQMQKRYEDAIAFYSLATVMDLDDPAPTFHTAECLIALGHLEDAADALSIVVGKCELPEQAALKSRAEALLGLLKAPQTAERSATK